ncbi:mevalonate kinase [Brachionus plicatilis]|uniref:Mevalonate kinase n=1 Tax=Brachionus plicatilis TaxID=10195 RepID=A0A3M7SML3_BRAPC|nr:mevalonate kinase [Brachionus plicatilis]
MFKEIKISSPGKIILCGEHAVVYGKKALACSVDLRTTLTASHTSNNFFQLILINLNKTVEIKKEDFMSIRSSPISSEPNAIINHLEKVENDKIVSSLKFFILLDPDLEWSKIAGLQVLVSSEIPIASGLGSSASYSTCLSSLFFVLGSNRVFSESDLETINRNAYYIEKFFHGNPSGLDNSVSTYGNFVVFEKGQIREKFTSDQKLNVLIINSQIPKQTLEQVKKVRSLYEKHTAVLDSLMNTVDILVDKFVQSLKEKSSLDGIKDLVTINQGLLYALQISNQSLNSIVNICEKFGFGAKITGAGGGGCCITIFDHANRLEELKLCLTENSFLPFETRLGSKGVRIDEIN